MIEMRWLVIEREMSAYVMERSVSRTYRVLQYRHIEGQGDNDGPVGWSEWKDVPVVDKSLPPADQDNRRT